MQTDAQEAEKFRQTEVGRFARVLALAVTLIAAVPALIGWMSAPTGSLYLGAQTALDDHMVYAAWMRQAMEGRLLFDNRFTFDAQPGLTFHAYFLVLGWLARVVTIPVAATIGRLAFTCLAVLLLSRLVLRAGFNVFQAKFALLFTCFGGGVGFLVWERFGEVTVNSPQTLQALFGGRLPIDVWQPEAFVFPSMLTNGLFMVSLCLMLWVLIAALEARDSWRPVLGGAVAYGLLMNIHSYDVLLLALVLVGLLVASLARGRATLAWALRVGTIGLGALPAALWFLYVLSQDAVFQSRAETPTFSSTFPQVLLGVLPSVALAAVALFGRERRAQYGGAALLALLAALFVAGRGHDPSGPFLSLGPWLALAAVGLGIVALVASEDDGWNLFWAWSVMGLVAVYFPALFQRKLAMMLIVPWAVLASLGLAVLLARRERSTRNMASALALVGICASSILWFQRETVFIRTDVSRTALHSVYISNDAVRIIQALDRLPGRKTVIAMPGVWNETGPAVFGRPLLTDLNPVLSGLTGAYTYAGHWSETPNYNRRRAETTAIFLRSTDEPTRAALLAQIDPDYIVAPNPEAFRSLQVPGGSIPIADLRPYGETVYAGTQFILLKRPRG